VRTTLSTEQERRLAQYAPGDPAVFRDLYRHYFPRVYAYIAYRVGSAPDSEDLAADVFVNVVEALGRFEYRGAGSLTAWIFRIAHNQVGQFYRQRRAVELALDDLPEIESDAPAPDYALQQKERFARLQSLITSLSPRRQEIITLRFYGGLRNQEIAEVLGLDERTVASHLCRALDDLHQMYVDENEMDRETHDESESHS
jgi:RNA polymerase sigma-70 factor, ECF subfamily